MSATAQDVAHLQRIQRSSNRSIWARLPRLPRRVGLLVGLIVAWQAYTVIADVNPLLVASPTEIVGALVEGFSGGTLAAAALTTLRMLSISMLAGIAVAVLFVAFANLSKFGEDLLILASSTLNPLPSIAILPLAIIWFGLSETALLFVVANAVVWPISINVHTGFKTVSPTLTAVGRSIGLSGWRQVTDVLLPSALPHIVSGIRTAIAFGWRTIVAAELVFGVAGGDGGLGFFINQSRFYLEVDSVFAALMTIAAIGVLIESAFAWIEKRTLVRWGVKSA